MSTDYKFQGWLGLDKTAAQGNMKWQEYEPKKWEETDIDIQVWAGSDNAASDKTDNSRIDHTLWHLRL